MTPREEETKPAADEDEDKMNDLSNCTQSKAVAQTGCLQNTK